MTIIGRISQSKGLCPDVSHEAIASWIVARFYPKSVVDIGCGFGGMLASLKEKGVNHITGYDKHHPSKVSLLPSEYTRHDLTSPCIISSRSDVCVCTEVAEHLVEAHARPLVSNLCNIASVVVFSAAVPLQGGLGHRNEQWQSWWSKLFAAKGMFPHSDFRDAMWNNEIVSPWYIQNLIVYANRETASKYGLTRCTSLDVVHPRLWSSIRWMGCVARLNQWLPIPIQVAVVFAVGIPLSMLAAWVASKVLS
jgi:hypothetical protein